MNKKETILRRLRLIERLNSPKKKLIFLSLILVIIGLTIVGSVIAGVSFKVDSLNKGLVGHWPLDSAYLNSTTNQVDDISGYANHGTNSGATLTTDRYGQANGAMSFIRTEGDNINCGTIIDSNFTEYSVSLWAKANTIDSGVHDMLISDVGGHWWYISINGSRWFYRSDNGSDSWGINNPVVDVWYHIVITHNGSSKYLYINGVDQGVKAASVIDDSSFSLEIGKYSDSYPLWNGLIADVRVYDRTLSLGEVKKLYELYKPKMSVGSLNKGLILDLPLRSTSEKLGSELVTNGTFDSDTWWTKEGTWTISNGTANVIGDGITNKFYRLNVGEIGKTYRIVFTTLDSVDIEDNQFRVDHVNGLVAVSRYIDDDGIQIWQNGRHIITTNGVSNGSHFAFYFTAPDGSLSIDDASIKEIQTADITPNSNHGEIYGADIRNQGTSFNGNAGGEAIWVGDIPYLDSLSNDFSISVWTKFNNLEAYRESILTASGSSGSYGTNGWKLWNSAGNYYWSVCDGDPYGDCAVRSYTVQDTNWHHFVGTWDASTNTVYVYKDGISGGSDNSITFNYFTNDYDVVIGGSDGGSLPTGQKFDGQIADVCIYDRLLTSTEALDLYNGKDVPGAILDMPLSDKTGFKDISGSGYHGTNYSSVIVGESADFDGTANYIKLSQLPSNITDEFTITSWFKTSSATIQDIYSEWRGGANIIIGLESDGQIRTYLNTYGISPAWTYNRTSALNDGKWHFLTAVYTGIYFDIYVDGNTADVETVSATGNVARSSYPARIGVSETSLDAYNNWFNGQISDVQIYSRAFSEAEIKSLYTKGRSGSSIGMTTGSLNKGLILDMPLKSKNEKVGDQMWDDAASTFESGTYNWNGWGITTIDNVGNALEITYGDAALGAFNYLTDSNDLNTNLTIGKNYRLTFDARSVGGTATAYGDIEVNPDPHVTTSTFTNTMKTYTLNFTANSTTSTDFSFRGLSVGNVITVDNIFLKSLKTADSTPNSNHGTIYGADVDSNYTTFNGTSDYTVTNNTIDVIGSASRTFSVWLYPEVIGIQNLLGYGLSSDGRLFDIYLNGDSQIGGHFYGAGYDTVGTGSPTYVLNQWQHFVISYDGTIARVYYDGEYYKEKTVALNTGSSQLFIGKGAWTSAANFKGRISSVKVYNRALSLSEIESLFDKERGQFGI